MSLIVAMALTVSQVSDRPSKQGRRTRTADPQTLIIAGVRNAVRINYPTAAQCEKARVEIYRQHQQKTDPDGTIHMPAAVDAYCVPR